MKSKEKRKKEKAKANQPPPNQNEEIKLRPGDLVITGSADATIKIWSLISGECFHVCAYELKIDVFLNIYRLGQITISYQKIYYYR